MTMIEDRARDVLAGELSAVEQPFEIVPGRLGSSGSPEYAVQVDNALSVVVPGQGESHPALITLRKLDGIVQVKLWPGSDLSYYVECAINSDPGYVLNWGAKMSDDPSVNGQGTRITVVGQAIHYFATPPASGSSDGSVRFWFQMQDGSQGNWNLLRIGVVPFRRN